MYMLDLPGGGTRKFLRRVQPGELARKCFAKRERFGALGNHEAGHAAPELAFLEELVKDCLAPDGLLEIAADDADASRYWRFFAGRDVPPTYIGAAPLPPQLA